MKGVLILVFLQFSVLLVGQKGSDQVYKNPVTITLKDGTVVYGDIKKAVGDSIMVYNSSLGNMTAHKSDVKYINKGTEKQVKDLNDYGSQYMLTQSAFGIKDSYYKNTWVFMSSFGIKLSDHFSFSATFEPISSMFSRSYVGTFNFKGTLPVADNFHLAAGFTSFTAVQEIIFAPYILGTIGNSRTNFTGGVYYSGERTIDVLVEDSGVLTLSLGASVKAGRKLNFYAETLISGNQLILGFVGIRKMYIKSGIALDLGLAGNSYGGGLPVFSLYFPLDREKQRNVVVIK